MAAAEKLCEHRCTEGRVGECYHEKKYHKTIAFARAYMFINIKKKNVLKNMIKKNLFLEANFQNPKFKFVLAILSAVFPLYWNLFDYNCQPAARLL